MEYTRSLQASKSRRNASVSPPWHASMVRSSMMCLLINSEIQPVRRMGWIISSILFETFEWEMKMNESEGWVGGEMDGSGEWVGGGECVGVENGWEWRMDSPPSEGRSEEHTSELQSQSNLV